MIKQRNKKYNPQKLQTMRNQGKVSRSVPLTALTPQQVALENKERVYQIDLRLFGIQGEEYEIETLVVKNPKNMDDLELKAKQYCASYAFDEDLLLNLDECYFEVRA